MYNTTQNELYLRGETYVRGFHITIACINLITAVTAIIGNGVVISAVWKTRALHTPSFILLCSLAWTDLLTGLFSQPLQAAHLLNTNSNARKILYYVHGIVGITLSIVSLFLLLVISINRLLAIELRLRYRLVVTKIRVRIAVALTPYLHTKLIL